jgi:probable HAF family extracellular repeat protein
MKRTICTALLLAVVAAVLMGTGPATGQPASPGQQYSITDLGTLPAGFESEAHGINNRGQIVGKSTAEFFLWHAFLWEKGKMTDLGTLHGGNFGMATDINDRGQVVGGSNASSVFRHAVLWTK